MKRLLGSGTLLGAALLFACYTCGTAYAADTGMAAKSAPPAAAQSHPAAAPAPAAAKPAMAKHHHKVMAHERMSLAMRKQIQTALNSHGADLKVDGMMGKKSRAAIKKFQTENGLKATGWADKATLEKLGVK